jgi:hyperosmotically inducible periplasmic protein
MKTRKLMNSIALLALFVALGVAGSASALAASSNQDQRTNLSRAELTKKVRKELVTLPYYGVFDNLAYEVNGSTVVLHGQVVRPTTRSDAERRIARIDGVGRVVNNIRVLPLSSFDDSLRQRTLRTLSRTGGLYRYFLGANPSIHIIVDRGNVTLEGVVSNRGDANLAYIAARGVSGSFSVTNNLRTDRGGAF